MKREGKQTPKTLPEWERLISTQLVFQARFPEVVLVGGTAAALHVQHRISVDADHVLRDLKSRFAEILKALEGEAGWRTKRVEPPVMILGHFKGVRTGVRQLLRSAPRELVYESMSQLAEGRGVHFERRMPARIAIHERLLCCRFFRHARIPSRRSVSCTRPPLTMLNTR